MVSFSDMPDELRDLAPFRQTRLLRLARMYENQFEWCCGLPAAGPTVTIDQRLNLAKYDHLLEKYPV